MFSIHIRNLNQNKLIYIIRKEKKYQSIVSDNFFVWDLKFELTFRPLLSNLSRTVCMAVSKSDQASLKKESSKKVSFLIKLIALDMVF